MGSLWVILVTILPLVVVGGPSHLARGDFTEKEEQSTHRTTSSYGNPDPGSLNQNQVKKPKTLSSKEREDTEDTRSSLADSVRIESASSLDLDSSEEEERENRQDPHGKNRHSAHMGAGYKKRI